MIIENEGNVSLENVTVEENVGSALCILESNVIFTGTSNFTRNAGRNGGGIMSKESVVSFAGECSFTANTAEVGGAINLLQGEVTFHTAVMFSYNTAGLNGGAIYSLGATVAFKGGTEFTSNSAQNGGALFFSNGGVMRVTSDTIITTRNNTATLYGGAIYHQDNIISAQCEYRDGLYTTTDQILSLPQCFLQLSEGEEKHCRIYSYADSAIEDGSFLYGGLLDKCRSVHSSPLYKWFIAYILNVEELPFNNTVSTIGLEERGWEERG